MQTCRVEARQCRVECWSPQAPFVISQACLVASNDVRLLQPCQSGLPSPSFFAPFSSDHPPRGQRPDGRGRSPLQLHLHALLLMQRGGGNFLNSRWRRKGVTSRGTRKKSVKNEKTECQLHSDGEECPSCPISPRRSPDSGRCPAKALNCWRDTRQFGSWRCLTRDHSTSASRASKRHSHRAGQGASS